MASIFDLLKRTPKKDESDHKNFMASSTHGTEIFSGDFFEEYLTEILGNEWAKLADRMRRSSGHISMLLALVKNPIIGATWDIDFKTDTDEEKKIKEFIEFNLFELIDFNQFLEEALTFIEFGHSVFEVVYRPQIKHLRFPNTITLKKFSFIDPKTIEDWNVRRDGDLESLRQCADGDLAVDVTIDANKLMTFAINKEGANFEGRSLLRPILGNWKRNQEFLKIKAMGHERSTMGTPIGVLPQGADKDEKRIKLQKVLAAFISHQRSVVVVPHGTEVKNFELSFTAADLETAIRAEREEMSQAFLAGFMDLGQGSGAGSFALSNNLLNIHRGFVQFKANKIPYEINKIIKTLVDVNFGERLLYPKLKVSNITDRVGKEFVENISMLTEKGYIAPNDTTKEYIRKKLNLPESDLEEEIDPNIDPETPPLKANPSPPQPKPVGLATQLSMEAELDVLNRLKDEGFGLVDRLKLVNLIKRTDSAIDKRLKGTVAMTFATKNKNAAVKLIEDDKKDLQELMQEELTTRRDKLLDSSKKIMNSNDRGIRGKVLEQRLPDIKKYKDLVFDFLVETSIKSTNQAKREVGFNQIEFAEKEDLAKLTPKTKERLRAEVDLITATQEADLLKNLYFPFNNNFDNTDSTDKVIEDMKISSGRYIEGPAISTGSANFVANAVNNSRNDIYQTPEVFEEIESFTIVNPSPVAAICVQLAGRVITAEQYINGDLPPYHHRCNTIVVANKKGAKGNPKINPLGLSFTGTPAEVEKIIKSRTL